jgi:hypothetical protein
VTDTELVRDKKFIENNLYIKNNQVYSKKTTIIEFPKWYGDKEFLDIQDVTYLYGIFAIIIDGKYSVSVIPTLISTVPIQVNEVKRDEEVYIQLTYGENNPIIDNIEVVKNEILSYTFFERFCLYAKIPWFIEYEDIIRIFDNLNKYAKSNLGEDYLATELVTSFIARTKKDKTVFYRQKPSEEIDFIDLINPFYSAISTVSKISGSYFSSGLVSALTQKEEKPNKLEKLVRQ